MIRPPWKKGRKNTSSLANHLQYVTDGEGVAGVGGGASEKAKTLRVMGPAAPSAKCRSLQIVGKVRLGEVAHPQPLNPCRPNPNPSPEKKTPFSLVSVKSESVSLPHPAAAFSKTEREGMIKIACVDLEGLF